MKIAKVTLICLIVLSNTLERTLKDQKHMPIAEKPFLRKLEEPATASDGEKCEEGGNYIIVKYSGEVKLQVTSGESTEGGQGGGSTTEGGQGGGSTTEGGQGGGSTTEGGTGRRRVLNGEGNGDQSQEGDGNGSGGASPQNESSKDSGIKYICAGGNKIKSDTQASEFQFYLNEDIESLENIFSNYEPTKISSLDFTNFKSEKLTNLNSLFKDCSSLTSINFGG